MANNLNTPLQNSINKIIVDLCLTSCPVLPAQGAASLPWPSGLSTCGKRSYRRKQTINWLWMGHRSHEKYYFSVVFPAEAEL